MKLSEDVFTGYLFVPNHQLGVLDEVVRKNNGTFSSLRSPFLGDNGLICQMTENQFVAIEPLLKQRKVIYQFVDWQKVLESLY